MGIFHHMTPGWRLDVMQLDIDKSDMWVGILHDDLDLFRIERDNGLFSWRPFSGNLHFSFLGRREKCGIMYLNDFVAWEGRCYAASKFSMEDNIWYTLYQWILN